MEPKWLEWARRIQAISQAGLTFSKDVFDKERYEQLRNISIEIMVEHTNHDVNQIRALFASEDGYQTPKLDIRGVVFRDNKILLVQEKLDNGRWALPGGYCDVGLSPSEVVTKEIQEESGYITKANKLLAVLDTNKHQHPPLPYHFYKLFVACEIVGGSSSTGIETDAVRFFGEDEFPELSVGRNTQAQLQTMFEFHRNPDKEAIFD